MLGCRQRERERSFFPNILKIKTGNNRTNETGSNVPRSFNYPPCPTSRRGGAENCTLPPPRDLLSVHTCTPGAPFHVSLTVPLPFHRFFPSRYGNCFERMEKLADTSVEGKLQFSSEFFWMERFSLSIRNCTVFSNPLVFARFWIHIGVDRGVDELCRGEVFYGF